MQYLTKCTLVSTSVCACARVCVCLFQSAAAAPSPVLGNLPPGEGMPVGPVPPGFFQVYTHLHLRSLTHTALDKRGTGKIMARCSPLGLLSYYESWHITAVSFICKYLIHVAGPQKLTQAIFTYVYICIYLYVVAPLCYSKQRETSLTGEINLSQTKHTHAALSQIISVIHQKDSASCALITCHYQSNSDTHIWHADQ